MPPAARNACGPSIRKFPDGDQRMTRGKRIYVLDTNVLMHDPTALFRFEEHDVFLPMTVLEELDAAKKGTSEVSRNARQVSRFIPGDRRHRAGGITADGFRYFRRRQRVDAPRRRRRIECDGSVPGGSDGAYRPRGRAGLP